MAYLAETDSDLALAPLQSAACTYRIALGPRAGQKVLSLKTVPTQALPATAELCVGEHGFSLHADVRCAANQRNPLERLCRYIARVRRLPTNGLNTTAPATSCCNSKARTRTGLPISCCHHLNSCNAWPL